MSPVPSDPSALQSVTPSQIYAWEGPGPNVDLTGYTETRMPSEQKWYAVTGRIVDAKVEADGDIHIALVDATGKQRWNCQRRSPGWPKVVRDSPDSVRLDGAEVSIQRQDRAHAEN
jgi:hypothetical protein